MCYKAVYKYKFKIQIVVEKQALSVWDAIHNAALSFPGGLCMTKPESIAVVLEFLTLVCSEGRMRDWLGKEGRGFWLPLLSLLSNSPVENPSASASRYSFYSV